MAAASAPQLTEDGGLAVARLRPMGPGLEVRTSWPAIQSQNGAHDLSETSPPTRAVRTERALRSAPVVLVRGVRMPAYAGAIASGVRGHCQMLPSVAAGEPVIRQMAVAAR